MKENLIEYRPFVFKKVLTEGVDNGPLIVEGVVQKAGEKNQNGRVYPKKVLDREIKSYKAGPVSENRAYGELDHPDSQVINLGNTCHVVRDVWWDGDDVIGRIEILDTPSGRILQTLFNRGLTVGISSRGLGSVKEVYESNTVEVQDDFELLCWDFVSTPSTHGAYVQPVNQLNESISSPIYRYDNVNTIISDIICNNTGMCQFTK
tara:strand:- start:111 stop:728 length:618 start_codon:yes stop_codon:yes gene_type:complete